MVAVIIIWTCIVFYIAYGMGYKAGQYMKIDKQFDEEGI